jgi:hypothetical protein
MLEVWRPVVGWEHLYEISSIGRVKRLRRYVERPVSGDYWIKEKILKVGYQKSGHAKIHLEYKDIRVTYRVHRMILEAFVGPCPDGKECRHLDGNPKNNNLYNLVWGTRSENSKDNIKHGKIIPMLISHKGEQSPNWKLSDVDVAVIRSMHKDGYSQTMLASIFNVSQAHISKIVLNQLREA